MTYDIIGWGALNIDRLCKVNEFADADGETFINEETKSCGGSAANTVIAASKLGLNTGYIGKIGNDSNGKMMYDYLKKNNVNVDGLIIKKGETGEVIGFVDKDGERKLYVNPKINDTINKNEVNVDYLKNTQILHITSFVGKNPEDPSVKTQMELLKELSSSIIISVDPGMLYANRGKEFMDELLSYTDILLVNKEELRIITGKDNLKEAIDEISDKIKIIVVKQSIKGSIIIQNDEIYHIKAFKVNTVDTTGAGDAYNAGFLYGVLNGYSLDEAGIIGSYIAARSTTKSGATEAIPTKNDINIEDLISTVKKQ